MKLFAALVGAVGLACVLLAVMVSRFWIARHFLPDFSISPAGRIVREGLGRVVLAIVGVLLIKAAAALTAMPVKTLRARLASLARIVLAVALAIGAAEAALALLFPRLFQPLTIGQEPQRLQDPVLGWINAPDRTSRVTVANRTVIYATDHNGNRIAPGAASNNAGPSIVFSGESYIFGYKLPWEETVPARVAAITGLNAVNLGVAAYSHEQSYLRLANTLPGIEQPAAVVSIFLPLIFRKDIDHTRPWLDASLVRHAPTPSLRIALLARWLFPYAGADDIANGAASVRASLRASAELARLRGAQYIIVVPRTAPEPPEERIVRETVLDEAGLRYVLVDLDPAWHIPGDRHPDARGAEAIADAIAHAVAAGFHRAP